MARRATPTCITHTQQMPILCASQWQQLTKKEEKHTWPSAFTKPHACYPNTQPTNKLTNNILNHPPHHLQITTTTPHNSQRATLQIGSPSIANRPNSCYNSWTTNNNKIGHYKGNTPKFERRGHNQQSRLYNKSRSNPVNINTSKKANCQRSRSNQTKDNTSGTNLEKNLVVDTTIAPK